MPALEQSLYDKIHDRFLPPAGGKAGTRYERLAAVVYAGLYSSGLVIHDLKLRGEVSGELHQIDVVIELHGARQRILLECKDFDLCGKPVGLSVVRNFSGVVADLKPDQAWIVSCNGFTKPARGFAKGFNIKLATLREFRESDWEGRVRTIILQMEMRGVHNVNFVGVESPEPEALQQVLNVLSQSMKPMGEGLLGGNPLDVHITVVRKDGRSESFADFINNDLQRRLPTLKIPVGPRTEHLTYDDLAFSGNGVTAPVTAITVSYAVTSAKTETRIEAPGIAILLLKQSDSDVVVWDKDLLAYTIDATGSVVSRSRSDRPFWTEARAQ